MIKQAHEYGAYDMCPCDSGQKVKFCCRKNGRTWIVENAPSRLPGVVTDYQHPQCYANIDNNCSQEISREHYIPESILRIIGEVVALKGPKFSNGKFRDFRTQVLNAKILCERHNYGFSALDSISARFFRTLDNHLQQLADQKPIVLSSEIKLFSGDDIERILLKILCGMVFGNILDMTKYQNLSQQKRLWVDLLIGRTPWPTGWGLYVQTWMPDTKEGPISAMQLGLGLGDQNNLTRFGFQFAGHHFMIRLADNVLMNNNQERARFRPEYIVHRRALLEKAVRLTWTSPGEGGFARANIHDVGYWERTRINEW